MITMSRGDCDSAGMLFFVQNQEFHSQFHVKIHHFLAKQFNWSSASIGTRPVRSAQQQARSIDLEAYKKRQNREKNEFLNKKYTTVNKIAFPTGGISFYNPWTATPAVGMAQM